MPEYYIDLNEIYEILPNQQWGVGQQRRSKGVQSVHHKLAAELANSIREGVLHNRTAARTLWVDGWNNLNYFIAGNRGTGKSTFLRYICKCISSNGEGLQEEQGEPIIRELFTCDPTAMPEKDHFFVDVVAAVKEKLTQTAPEHAPFTGVRIFESAHNHGPGHGKHSPNIRMGAVSQECISLLDRLARGIKQLSKQQECQADRDPLALLNADIKDRTSSIKLKRQFDELINKIAECYHIDAFYIAIDDADILSTRNVKILETIRTYLTHPRIIILFTGDKRLINEVLRQNQFGQFDPDFHKTDAKHKAIRWDIVENMAAQYIKKVFPPTNYFQLPTLWELIQEDTASNYKLIPPHQNTPSQQNVDAYVKEVFLASIAPRPWDADILTEGFFRLPIRSIVHTLRYWFDRGISKVYPPAPQAKVKREDIAKLLYDSFSSTYFSELFSLGFNKRDMEVNSLFRTCQGLLLHCARSTDVSCCHHLATSSARFEQQESVLMLAAKTACTVRNMEDILTYLLFGPFTAHAFRYFRNPQHQPEGKPGNLANFESMVFSDDATSPSSRARNISHIFLIYGGSASERDFSTQHGIIQIRGEHHVNILKIALQHIASDVCSTKGGGKLSEEALHTFLIAATTVGKIDSHEDCYYVSPYNFCSFMLECIQAMGKNPDAESDAVLELLQKYAYRMLQINSGESQTEGEDKEQGAKQGRKLLLDALRDMAGKIVQWHHNCPLLHAINAAELGEIADYLYHFFDSLADGITKCTPTILYGERASALTQTFPPVVSAPRSSFFNSILQQSASFPLLKNFHSALNTILDHAVSALDLSDQEQGFIRQQASIESQLKESEREISSIKESITALFKGSSRYRRTIGKGFDFSLIRDDDSAYEACRIATGQFELYSSHLQRLDSSLNGLDGMLGKLQKELKAFPVKLKALYDREVSILNRWKKLVGEHKAFMAQSKQSLLQSFKMSIKETKHNFLMEQSDAAHGLTQLYSQLEELLTALKSLIEMDQFKEQVEPLLQIYASYAETVSKFGERKRLLKVYKQQLESHPVIASLLKTLDISKGEISTMLEEKADEENEAAYPSSEWTESRKNLHNQFTLCSLAIASAIVDYCDSFHNKMKAQFERLQELYGNAYIEEQKHLDEQIEQYHKFLINKELIFSASPYRSATNRSTKLFYLNFASSFGLHHVFQEQRDKLRTLRIRLFEKRPNLLEKP